MIDGGVQNDRLQAPPAAINRTHEGVPRVLGITGLATNPIRIIEEEPIVIPQFVSGLFFLSYITTHTPM